MSFVKRIYWHYYRRIYRIFAVCLLFSGCNRFAVAQVNPETNDGFRNDKTVLIAMAKHKSDYAPTVKVTTYPNKSEATNKRSGAVEVSGCFEWNGECIEREDLSKVTVRNVK